MDPPSKDSQVVIVNHPPLIWEPLSTPSNRRVRRPYEHSYSLESEIIMQFSALPTRSPQYNEDNEPNWSIIRLLLRHGASPFGDVSDTRSPSMAQQNERRTPEGRRLFDMAGDGVSYDMDFANKENWRMDMMDSQGQCSTTLSNKQELYQLGWNTLRDYLESSTITIDNVKSKIHGTPHDSIDAWCFGIMSLLAFAMMILVGGPTSIDGWSSSGTIVRLVFILGTQPLWNHRASIQTGGDLEGTTKQRAVGGFLVETQPPIHQSSSRRVRSSSISWC